MVYNVYSVQDVKTTFFSPTLDLNDEAAKRNFELMLVDAKGVMKLNPADFRLYRVGEFNVSTGELSRSIVPEFIAGGEEFVGV